MTIGQCGSEAPASSFTRDTKLNHGFQAKSGRSSAEGVTRYGRSLCHQTRLLSSVRIRRATGAPERHSRRSRGQAEDTCSRNSCGCGGIGRHPGLRSPCREACRFNSCHPYQVCRVIATGFYPVINSVMEYAGSSPARGAMMNGLW